MESLNDKLKSLGVDLGMKKVGKPAKIGKKPREKIETFVQGEELLTAHGPTYVVKSEYPLGDRWGDFPVYEEADHTTLLQCAKMNPEVSEPLSKMIFMDTETTGLAGGSGTLAFMVGLGYYTEEAFVLYQYFLRTPEEERAMLTSIDQLMAEQERSIVVSYNGKSFDTPLLNTRYVINQMDSPFKKSDQIDLLHFARRFWKKRLPSRTLGFIENEVLGFYRSEEEVPGWMAPELYFEYLREGKAEGVSHVFYHNAVDIVSLGVLEILMAKLLCNPAENESLHGLDQLSIAKMFIDAQQDDAQVLALYDSATKKTLPEQFSVQGLLEYGHLLKRREAWEEAVKVWERAAAIKSLEACEELAKYYEHQRKDYETAIRWVNRGFEILEKYPKYQFKTRQLMDAFQHRLERNLKKWQGIKEN